MKIAFITDMHLAEDPLRPGQIYAHQAAGLDEVVAKVTEHEPDWIFLGGDNSGHGIPHYARPAERNAHVKLRQELCEIADVFEVEGNHDVPGDYAFFSKIKTWKRYHLQPSNTFEVISRREGLVCLLPWQFQNSSGSHIEEVRAVVKQLNARIDDHPAFLLGHCAINEGLLREGQPKVPVKDPVISINEFDWDYIEAGFFGHYHHPQFLNDRSIYGGSLFSNEYGESFERGFHIWDSDEELEDRFKLICIESQRPKIKLFYDWREEVVTKTEPDLDIDQLEDGDLEGCLVKIEVIGDAKTRSAIDKRAASVGAAKQYILDTLGAEAVSMKYPKKPARETRRVSKGVSEGRTLEGRVESFLKDHDEPRQDEKTIKRALEIYRSL